MPLLERLDRLPCGMVLCDASAQVHWRNASADRLLAAGPVRLIGSRLFADSRADMDALLQKLAEAASSAGNSVRYLCLGQGELTLHLAIQGAARSSSIALLLSSPRRAVDIPTDALIQLFGLTPAEGGLVAALANGSTLEQYAQQRGVSVGTARVHLKASLKKTGTRRQSELVRLVCTSVASHAS